MRGKIYFTKYTMCTGRLVSFSPSALPSGSTQTSGCTVCSWQWWKVFQYIIQCNPALVTQYNYSFYRSTLTLTTIGETPQPFNQSVTSRLETSRYRDFSQFVESIGLGLKNFGLEKKSGYRSRKYLVSKKSRYRSRKYLVSKKSLCISLENIWYRKKSRYWSQKYLVSKKVSVSVSKILV